MPPVSFKRHRFPPDVIRLAGWLYFRVTFSLRDVAELLAQRGIEASYETIGCWTLKFGRAFARNLRRSRPTPTGRWHLDEMVVKICGERMWLWRAVDDEGEVLDMLVQKRRDTQDRLQQLHRSKTPDPPIDSSPLSSRSRSHVGGGHRGCPSDRSLPAHCAFGRLT